MLHWSARAPCLHGRLSSNVRPQNNGSGSNAGTLRHRGQFSLPTLATPRSRNENYEMQKPPRTEPLQREPRNATSSNGVAPPDRISGRERLFGHQFVEPAASGRLPSPSSRVLGGGKVSGRSCSRHWVVCQARSCGLVAHRSRLAVSPRLRPNPSLEPTRSGMAPRPPSAEYHVALAGRGATPPRSPQLKR
jgi:hypothetical protein